MGGPTRRGFLGGLLLGVGALFAACRGAIAPPAADGDVVDRSPVSAAIDEKIRNPPALALEPPDSSFTNPNPIFIPPQTIFRRWRVNTVESHTTVDLHSWRLTIDGMIERPRTLDYAQVLAEPYHRQASDLHCVEGWGFTDIDWEGILLSTILDTAGVTREATHVNFFTFPGIYSDSLTLDQARLPDTMLAYRANGEPLKEQHGYPLRLVVPTMYGYKSVKWLDRIEVVRGRHLGYWEQRGWRPDPWIR
ncbi:MAG: hypothetical protein FJ033_09780 [Chloroflexi bacterium]|nr:hypothetical protein [Chloroflexota bacterium]